MWNGEQSVGELGLVIRKGKGGAGVWKGRTLTARRRKALGRIRLEMICRNVRAEILGNAALREKLAQAIGQVELG